MVTQENKSEAKELIDYIIKCSINCDWEDTFDSLVEEYRKDFSQLTLAKIMCSTLCDEMYVPYRQECINGRMYWEMERYEINQQQVKFFYNDTNKISKQEAMRCLWFRSNGRTVVGDPNFIEKTDYIVINKEDDYIVLFVSDIVKIYELIKKLEKNGGIYEENDIDILAEMLSEEKLFGEYKRYLDEETGKEYYGFPFCISHKRGFTLDFVDKKSGIVSFTDDKYRSLKKL